MEHWIITYNDIYHPNELLYGTETISGKSASDALIKRFKRKFRRLTGDAGRYANVILIKGYSANGVLHYASGAKRLCYGLDA